MERLGRFALRAILGALLFACDGGAADDDLQRAETTTLLFDPTDVCNAKVPTPTDLFRDETGKSALSDCPGPADPIERELHFAQLDEGTPLNAEIVIPVMGTLDGASLNAEVELELGGGGSPDTALPPLLMLKRIGTGTSAADFEVIPVSASFDDAIRVEPSIALEAGHQYVVVATTAIRDDATPKKSVYAADLTRRLVESSPIVAGGALDETSAARLERTRQQLQPIVQLLAQSSPPIAPKNITSIQIFTTVPNPLDRVSRIFEAYRAALQEGRYAFEVTTIGGDRPPAELYPDLPDFTYDNLQAYRRGTIRVPQFLGDDLRQRDGFPEVVREIEIPFIVTIPKGTGPYPVVLYTPGFGRSKLDVRALANEMAGPAGAAVLAIDLRCHGDRSPDANGVCAEGRTQAEVAALTDEAPNNGNMELIGADGIPDASGQYFFPGDARALRDTQIAAAIEILHVYEALRDNDAFAGVLNRNADDLHLIAHGHSAYAALLAVAFMNVAPKTVQVPAGGAGTDLIAMGPAELRASFVATLPEGIGEARAAEYLARLEASFLRSVSIETIGALVREKLSVSGEARRLLLSHGVSTSAVPVAARDRLKAAVPIPSNRVRMHPQSCDEFFIFSCRLGIDDPTAPRDQMVTFVFSDGTSVVGP